MASEHVVAACGEASCKGRRQKLESVLYSTRFPTPVPLPAAVLALEDGHYLFKAENQALSHDRGCSVELFQGRPVVWILQALCGRP